MATYIFIEDWKALGQAGDFIVPYTGPALNKMFVKGNIVEGIERTVDNGRGGTETAIFVVEDNTLGATDRDTGAPFTGKATWFIAPDKVERFIVPQLGPQGPFALPLPYTSPPNRGKPILWTILPIAALIGLIALWRHNSTYGIIASVMILIAIFYFGSQLNFGSQSKN